jgi:D-3-phosphoglycerate dehydrogenase
MVFWNAAGDAALERSLSGLSGVALTVTRDAAGTAAVLADADGLIVSAAFVSEALIERIRSAPRLSWVHLINAGYDNVVRHALPARLTVTHSPGAGATTVAEHGLGLMLALARRLPEAINAQYRAAWDHGLHARMISLEAKTLVVLGFGHIGRALARLVQPFGMKVVAVSRGGRPSDLAAISCRLSEVEAHLPAADFVVVAAPLTADTRGFLNAERLALLGEHAFLVNLSRGAIVDSLALSERLHGGGLAGAALDVTDPEPLPAGHPLWTAPRLILTPHAAAAGTTPFDCAQLLAVTTENARRFSLGEPLLHIVHPDTLQAA